MAGKDDKKSSNKKKGKKGTPPRSLSSRLIKVLIFISVIVAAVAALLALDAFKEHREVVLRHLPNGFTNVLTQFLSALTLGKLGKQSPHSVIAGSFDRLFTKEELKDYDGSEDGKGLCLAILGRVYDVSKGTGTDNYKPGGGYHFFTGRDGTRAFMTGEFDEKGLIDDVVGLTFGQMTELENWIKFYDTSYIYVGKVVGNFYDSQGNPTEALYEAERQITKADEHKIMLNEEKKIFPPCNSQYKPADNIKRIWCHPRSGGSDRGWTGVPRQYFRPGSDHPRCVCVRTTGSPHDDPSSTIDRGDLDNPHMKLYDNCEPMAESCNLPP